MFEVFGVEGYGFRLLGFKVLVPRIAENRAASIIPTPPPPPPPTKSLHAAGPASAVRAVQRGRAAGAADGLWKEIFSPLMLHLFFSDVIHAQRCA